MRALLLLLFCVYAWGGDCSTDTALYNTYVGYIGDVINSTTLEYFVLYHPCGSIYQKTFPTRMMELCDENGDGIFNETDLTTWRSCFKIDAYRANLCQSSWECDNMPQ